MAVAVVEALMVEVVADLTLLVAAVVEDTDNLRRSMGPPV
jgi:hypothetical protein